MQRSAAFIALGAIACNPVQAERPLSSDAVNLTSAALVAGLASSDRAEQDRARMYLLGVLDATEGRAWCDYKTVQTASLQELVYEALKQRPLESRAAAEIEAELQRRLPCTEPPAQAQGGRREERTPR